jgi:hypothetical protein
MVTFVGQAPLVLRQPEGTTVVLPRELTGAIGQDMRVMIRPASVPAWESTRCSLQNMRAPEVKPASDVGSVPERELENPVLPPVEGQMVGIPDFSFMAPAAPLPPLVETTGSATLPPGEALPPPEGNGMCQGQATANLRGLPSTHVTGGKGDVRTDIGVEKGDKSLLVFRPTSPLMISSDDDGEESTFEPPLVKEVKLELVVKQEEELVEIVARTETLGLASGASTSDGAAPAVQVAPPQSVSGQSEAGSSDTGEGSELDEAAEEELLGEGCDEDQP